jgi:hypothetical protein
VDGVLWVRVPPDAANRRLPGKELLAPPFGPRLAAAYVTSARAQAADLLFSADDALSAYFNGAPVADGAALVGFEADARRHRVALREGRNLLVLRLRPRTLRSRLLVRLCAPGALDPPAGVEGAPFDPPKAASIGVSAGKRTVEPAWWTVELRLSRPLHWADVLDPGNYLLETADGTTHPLLAAALEYDPARRVVSIRAAKRPTGIVQLRLAGRFRDVFADPAELRVGTIKLEVR